MHAHVESDALIHHPLLEVRAEATFELVKLTNLAVHPRQEEYAYKTTVKIGGRFFQGFLFDQGLDRSINVATTTTVGEATTNVQHLELLQLASTNSNPMMDFESFYSSGKIHVNFLIRQSLHRSMFIFRFTMRCRVIHIPPC